MRISELLGEKYLERFRVYHEVTLFPPNWEALKKYRCPLCGNRLQLPRTGKLAMCKGIKHRKPFIIKTETLKKFSPTLD